MKFVPCAVPTQIGLLCDGVFCGFKILPNREGFQVITTSQVELVGGLRQIFHSGKIFGSSGKPHEGDRIVVRVSFAGG